MILSHIESLPQAAKANAILEVKRELYRKDLFLTAKYLLGYKDIVPHCHGDMITALMEPTIRKLIVMPRGTFKTSITCVAYPIWMMLSNPNLRILIDSELYSNSKNTLREIKSHLLSEKFISLFGNWKTSTWNEGEIIIKARAKTLKEATITCSGIGAQKTGQHYDLILADDMNSPANSNTPEGCQKVIQHYRYYTSLLDPGGVLAVSATRYSSLDLPQIILDNEVGELK
jgi:hypothetical protein